MDPTGPLARRFPLVARIRPVCSAFNVRVGELRSLADTAEAGDSQATAAAVFNQAALLASDIGLPDLARSWCHQHAAVYLQAAPLDEAVARLALEPVVNLVRLHVRAGQGATAYQLLDELVKAVMHKTDVVVDGLAIPASTLTTSQAAHDEVCRWLWTVHLTDGTRALTTTGHWHDALTHVQRHRGIGQRMLDGRQVAIITAIIDRDTAAARQLLNDTAAGEPTENAVTALLTALCRQSLDQPVNDAITTVIDHYLQLDPVPGRAVFDARLGLSIIDAIAPAHDPGAHRVTATLIRRTLDAGDGYAARELLAHPDCRRWLTASQADSLAGTVTACRLGGQQIPPSLEPRITAALDIAEQVLARTLTQRHRQGGQQCVSD